MYLHNTTLSLGITDYNVSLSNAILFLKNTKSDYKRAKKDHQLLCNRYVADQNQYNIYLHSKRSKKKMKARWKKFKKYFGKTRMNLISEVKYFLVGSLIRVSSKVKIEERRYCR